MTVCVSLNGVNVNGVGVHCRSLVFTEPSRAHDGFCFTKWRQRQRRWCSLSFAGVHWCSLNHGGLCFTEWRQRQRRWCSLSFAGVR